MTPPIISPISSPSPAPAKQNDNSIEKDQPNFEVFRIDLNCNKKDWPSEIQTSEIDLIPIFVEILGNEKSTEISLRRTLKKCNLRSIEPKRQEFNKTDRFVYSINIRKNSLQNLLIKIQNNWISIEESMLFNFQMSLKNTWYIIAPKNW